MGGVTRKVHRACGSGLPPDSPCGNNWLMCGRFVMTYSAADIQDFYLVSEVVDPDLVASWNVAPKD